MDKLFQIKEYLLHLVELMLGKDRGDGFIESKPGKNDYMHETERLGMVVKEEYLPGGQWMSYRPEKELQNRGSETMACVTFSAHNCIEAILKHFIKKIKDKHESEEMVEIVKVFEHFGLIDENGPNFSDRYIAKLSNTSVRGNTQTRVANAIRKYGMVPEKDWAYVPGWSNYYKAVPQELIERGKAILKYIEINYEWVSPVHFPHARKYGPIQTSVYAWGAMKNGIFPRTSLRRNHATVNDGATHLEFHNIHDSYHPIDKKVAWNFNLGGGIIFSIHLKKKIFEEFNEEAIEKLRDRGLKYILRAEAAGQVYELREGHMVHMNSKDITDAGIKELSENKELVGISEELFNKLIS